MRKTPKRIGLAIVGAGRVGLFRGEVAARHPMVDFIGLADLKEDRLELVQKKTRADFATTDFYELLKRPEITAAIISTDEHLHVEPILAAAERGLSLLIEKPLATELARGIESVLAGQQAGVRLECATSTPGGEHWYEVVAEPLRRPTGGAVVMLTDLTARKRAELEAQQHRAEAAHAAIVGLCFDVLGELRTILNEPLHPVLEPRKAVNERRIKRFHCEQRNQAHH